MVKISYSPAAIIHPAFDQRTMNWEGERVQIVLTPSLQGETLRYLANNEKVFLADKLRQRGFRHVYKINGQGTPLVVFSRNPENTPKEKHYPPSGIVLGITAVKENRRGRLPILKLYDAFDPECRQIHLRHASHRSQLHSRFARSLLACPKSNRQRCRCIPESGSSQISYWNLSDPSLRSGQIPILFIHGLISSPISWQNLTNDLCSDPTILERYQPWFFLYPTGQPVRTDSGVQLRNDLQATQKLFDPNGTAVASRHVVVIAHSMGGLLAHTLVSDSGDAVWDGFATRPFAQFVALGRPEANDLETGYFFFRHQPCIDQVIFLAVPHRGSTLAAGLVGSIGNRLIQHAKTVRPGAERV